MMTWLYTGNDSRAVILDEHRERFWDHPPAPAKRVPPILSSVGYVSYHALAYANALS